MMLDDRIGTGQLLAHRAHCPEARGLLWGGSWSQGAGTLQKSFLLAASTSSAPAGTPACYTPGLEAWACVGAWAHRWCAEGLRAGLMVNMTPGTLIGVSA